jgi:hypothetical protein
MIFTTPGASPVETRTHALLPPQSFRGEELGLGCVICKGSRADSRVRVSERQTEMLLDHCGQIRSLLQVD